MSFSMKKRYVRTDGWRGYEEPVYAVAGANDTGSFPDSPCRTEVATRELGAIRKLLRKEGIATRAMVCSSSNVFCVHRYLIAEPENVDRARDLVKAYIDNNVTDLSYYCDGKN